MPSPLQTDDAEHNEIQQMDHGAPFKRSSLQHPAPRFSDLKVSSSMERKPLKPGKAVEKNVDDVVKYMSNVPSYLQRLEKGDNIQEKALNFGVLDWGRLEKWTNLQKQVDADRRWGSSPSSSNLSSSSASSSTFASSSKSTRSAGSHSIQRRQSPALNAHEQNCVQIMRNPDSRTSHSRPLEEGNTGYLNMKSNSVEKHRPPDVCSSSSSIFDEIQDLAQNKAKSQISLSKEEEKFHNCEQEGFSGNLNFAEDWLQDQCTLVEGVWDRLQECEHERPINHDSVILNHETAGEASRKSFSGKFPAGDYPFTIQPPIPVSCPLPSANMKSCEGKTKVSSATRRELSPRRILNAGLKKIRNSTSGEGSSGQQMKQKIVSDNSREEISTYHSKSRRSLSPHRLLRGMSQMRDSVSREGSSGKGMKQTTCSSDTHEENAASGSRGRQSPLRRILYPLVKPKNQIQAELKSGDEACKSLDGNINPILQTEKEVISVRQALLKLAWKNDLPLFVFSANDHDILAATMGKGSTSRTNDFNCNYTMFTAHEIKKKVGLWMGHGNKRKNHDFIYNVVGQMRVSSPKSTSSSLNDHGIMREFVLLGSELTPTAHGCVTSSFNSELAAIVIKVPTEWTETKHSTQNLQNESLGLAHVTAILPNGIHGISSKGNPSPLIERWKSGGSCDCGGWDEGCILTVLMDKIQEGKSASSSRACSADGTRRIELFPLGEDRENMYTFRMAPFKEGVYTVEFGASIALVQAFAMSIAILHGRNPRALSEHHYSINAQSIASEKHLTSYAPIRPPLSPAGRA